MNCELCGKGEENLVFAFVENVKFRVCSNCRKFGKVVNETSHNNFNRNIIKKEENFDIVRSDCGLILKNFRESKGMTQQAMALILKEREATIAKFEQGSLNPSVDFARKLEKFSGLRLVMKEKIDDPLTIKAKNQSLTIGDIIKKSS